MFDQLPETIPHKHTKKFKAFGAALALQSALVVALIILQMAMPEKLGQFELIAILQMAPPVPPPPPAPVSPAPKQVQHVRPKQLRLANRPQSCNSGPSRFKRSQK